MVTCNNQFTLGEMTRMFMHWDEHSRAQFSDDQYHTILSQLNELVLEFGRQWVEQLAGVRKTTDKTVITTTGNNNVGDSAIGIMRAVQFNEDWSAIKHCLGADKLHSKLETFYNNHHVDLEVQVAAAFAKCGAIVELEPQIPSGKVPDLRVRRNDKSWLYIEVSKRIFEPRDLKRDTEILLRLCLEVATGLACFLHIYGEFHDSNFKSIHDWLDGLRGTMVTHAKLDGLAEFRSFHHAVDMTTEILMSREPPLEVETKGDLGTSTFATLYYYVPDFGFEGKFADERGQLPPNEHGIIVFDVTGITGSMTEWEEKAIQALSLSESAHIIGVVLLAKGVDSTSFPRWRFDAKFALNPKILNPPPELLDLIRRAFQGRV
jgi:hypothetical protein